jgi:hypothetical protein
MTPKQTKRAVNRRARQNKRSGMSSLMTGPDTKVWNVNAEQTPNMRALNVKDNKIYEFSQSSSLGIVLTSSNTVFQGYAKAWTAGDINQFSSFAAI